MNCLYSPIVLLNFVDPHCFWPLPPHVCGQPAGRIVALSELSPFGSAQHTWLLLNCSCCWMLCCPVVLRLRTPTVRPNACARPKASRAPTHKWYCLPSMHLHHWRTTLLQNHDTVHPKRGVLDECICQKYEIGTGSFSVLHTWLDPSHLL